jgi:hypothetical protein
MKFNVYAVGDNSVGIPDFNTDVEIKDCDLKDVEDCIGNGREELRKDLKKLFDKFFVDGSCRVSFEDECLDCGKLKKLCKNKKHP